MITKCTQSLRHKSNVFFGFYIGVKISNGYSKLANYQLGGSGFQVKSRNSSYHKSKKHQGSEKLASNGNVRGKRNAKRINGFINESHDESTDSVLTTQYLPQGLFVKPKSFLRGLFKQENCDKYGELNSSNTLSCQEVPSSAGRSHSIATLNELTSNNDTKG